MPSAKGVSCRVTCSDLTCEVSQPRQAVVTSCPLTLVFSTVSVRVVLPPGAYFADASDDQSGTFARQVYNGLPCITNGCSIGNGTSIIVNSAGLTIPNINFALTAGTGSIS